MASLEKLYLDGSAIVRPYTAGVYRFRHHRFPETHNHKSNILSASKKSFAVAKVTYENQINTLIISCRCRICTKENEQEDSERSCRVALFETILALAFRLADMAITENLFPKRS